MGAIVGFSLLALTGLLGHSDNLRIMAAFMYPFLALVGGFSTLMALWYNPQLEEKHPRMRKTLLIMMGIIALYMIIAVLTVAT